MVKQEKKIVRFKVWDLANSALFCFLLIISLVFYFLVDKSIGKSFGFSDILWALIFAVVVGTFFFWIRAFMMNNPYLFAGIGFLGIGALCYGFSLRYVGRNSTIFMIIGIFILLAYLIFSFIKFRKNDNSDEKEFDDS